MTLTYIDRVKETTTTTGTGTYTLAGAVTGFQAFSTIGNGNTCYYAVSDGTSWEVGLGTYTLSGTTLARTTLLASSTGSAINWGVGTRTVWLDFPAAAISTFLIAANNLSDLPSKPASRLNLAVPVYVATRTAMAALSGATDLVVWLEESGRQGMFQWAPGNQSAHITADPLQGVWVAPASAPTGASGAWLRQGVVAFLPEWFGAVPDGSSDSGPGIRAARDYINSISGGTLQLSAGTYLFSTLRTTRMVEPAANMTIEGQGPACILKLGNSVGTAGFFGIAGQNPNNSSNTYNNFTCRNFAIDFNGASNLVTAYSPGIYIGFGTDITIDGVTFLNYPGSQPCALGVNAGLTGFPTTPQVINPIITNCRFENIGKPVNPAVTDSSAIFVVCTDGVISDNIMVNATQDTAGTGIELHGTGTCTGNVMDKVSKAYNVGSFPNTAWAISNNIITSFNDYLTVWNISNGLGPNYNTRVVISNDYAVTSLFPSSAGGGAIDCSQEISATGANVFSVKIGNCHFENNGGSGNANASPFITIGKLHAFEMTDCFIFGWPAEIMVINSTTSIANATTLVQFNSNHVENMCCGSTAGHTIGILLNDSTNKMSGFMANDNIVQSNGGPFMTKFVQGTALPVTPAPVLSGNLLINVATLGP